MTTGFIDEEALPATSISDSPPLVTCIMPTCNRRHFVPQAIRYFLRQRYEPKELIIVDDSDDSVADCVPDDTRIRLIRLEARVRVGTKRNLACEQARGEIIVHWDDDDWMDDGRVACQVQHLRLEQADICGLSRVLFVDPSAEAAWEYVFPGTIKPWVYGASLCYTISYWRNNPFANIDVGEDTRFVWNDPEARIAMLADNRWLVALMHPGNTSPKRPDNSSWHPRSFRAIKELIGHDWSFYADGVGADSGRPRSWNAVAGAGESLRERK